MPDGAGTDEPEEQNLDEALSEEMGQRAWKGHRKRQLQRLGIDPEEYEP